VSDTLGSAALDALGDPHRRAIVEILGTGRHSVQEIADQLPISRPAVSRHLRLLKQAGLVSDEPEGTRRRYELRADGVDAIRAYFRQVWGEAATRFQIATENTSSNTSGQGDSP
jgi:DNA-binding transcriptional ArsR family regulator